MKIWLDDIRLPPSRGWLWLRDIDDLKQFRDEIGFEYIREISFDHDLGQQLVVVSGFGREIQMAATKTKATGYDCAKLLIEYHMEMEERWSGGFTFPKWSVHSANPVGAENITKLLENYEKHITNEKQKSKS